MCDPAEESTEAPDTCFVFQMNTDGNNKATCRESTDANPVALTCDVSQFNESGNNHADIDQRVRQTTGAMQDAQVSALLEQENGSGDNHANVSQTISQSTSEVSLLAQSQEAEFDALVDQDADDGGNNHLQQSQTLDQMGRASGSSSINQSQSADHFGEVDQDALVFDEELLAYSTAPSSQTDDGFSKATVSQTERQTLIGPGSQERVRADELLRRRQPVRKSAADAHDDPPVLDPEGVSVRRGRMPSRISSSTATATRRGRARSSTTSRTRPTR